MDTNTMTAPQIHIRYEGQSLDISLNDLDVGVLSNDEQIRTAVATHLNVPLTKLRNFAIDRNEATGHLTLRPEAVFG
jgi:hypothetical protein